MKKLLATFIILSVITLSGCATISEPAQIVTTTLPVYEFTQQLCTGTGISVERLITENVSCLHDYTLQVRQMQLLENAEIVILSGAGLDDFAKDTLTDSIIAVDASENITLLCADSHHDHSNEHTHDDSDPHIWLSPINAKLMTENIYNALCNTYPEHKPIFTKNLLNLNQQFDALQAYGTEQLANLSHRDIVTFHDGFAYLANAFDLHILRAIEEESGSEASAREIIELITLIGNHNVQGIFTEENGTASSAHIISRETEVSVYVLDMAMSERSYFDAMYHNINTLKEALQ